MNTLVYVIGCRVPMFINNIFPFFHKGCETVVCYIMKEGGTAEYLSYKVLLNNSQTVLSKFPFHLLITDKRRKFRGRYSGCK